MMNLIYHPWIMTLAQVIPQLPQGWEDGDTTPATAPAKQAPLSFGDLQQGMRNWRSADSNGNGARNWLLAAVAGVAVLVLVVQMQQRWQNRKKVAQDGEYALYRELTHGLRLPWGTTVLLWWIARAEGVSMAALLVSPSLFKSAMTKWVEWPTYGLVRRMAQGRVKRVQRMLFG